MLGQKYLIFKIIFTLWNIIIYIISSLFTLLINTLMDSFICVYILFSQTALYLYFNIISPDQNIGRNILACALLG